MRKWLARLSFSLIIVAVVLAYEGRQTLRGERDPRPAWAGYAFFAGAAVCFGLGLRGVRERHRAIDQSGQEQGDDGRDQQTRGL